MSASTPPTRASTAWPVPYWVLLLGVVAVAAAVRIWGLADNPPGLFRDEAEKGYTALELWRTGRHGEFVQGAIVPTRPVPFFLEAGGVQTSAIYQYLAAPIVGLFGLSVGTTRLPAALAGILLVALAAWLAAQLEAGRQSIFRPDLQRSAAPRPRVAALAAAGFVALSPTHVLFSRWAQQGVTVPVFATLGVCLVLAVAAAGERHRRALAVLAGLAFGLAFYAYAPARLVVPVILLGLAWEMGGDWKRLVRAYWPAAVAFFVIAVPVFLYAMTAGSGRFERVSVFAGRSLPEGVGLFLLNYLRHFDPRFLFFFGDANPRHAMALSGLIPWGETAFFLIGLVTLRRLSRPGSRLLLVWVLAAPLAASLTAEGIPHALRSILFFPAVHLVSARGVLAIAERLNPRAALGVLAVERLATGVLLIVALASFLPKRDQAFQYGVLEALDRMWEANSEGPNVLSVEVPYAHYYVLFHDAPDPAEFQENGLAAAPTMLLAPGMALPPGALVARMNADIFAPPGPLDILSPTAEPGSAPVMTVRPGW
ncbi:hypothetical protein KQI84_18495 [bacterium]|nr:hypothetical protein [bacterium]